MNFEQIKGIIERIITIFVTWFVAKGWVPAGMSAELVTVVLGILSVIWGFWVNTPKALADAAVATKT